MKPRVVLETGVANGHSTAVMLNAIMGNEYGELRSIDIRPDAGALLTDKERAHWNFHLLPPINSKQAFREIVKSIAPIDLFFHDSQHSYDWQIFEHSTAGEHINSGLLASDDVDGNYAFLDFAASLNMKPLALFDRTKVSGLFPSAHARTVDLMSRWCERATALLSSPNSSHRVACFSLERAALSYSSISAALVVVDFFPQSPYCSH